MLDQKQELLDTQASKLVLEKELHNMLMQLHSSQLQIQAHKGIEVDSESIQKKLVGVFSYILFYICDSKTTDFLSIVRDPKYLSCKWCRTCNLHAQGSSLAGNPGFKPCRKHRVFLGSVLWQELLIFNKVLLKPTQELTFFATGIFLGSRGSFNWQKSNDTCNF